MFRIVSFLLLPHLMIQTSVLIQTTQFIFQIWGSLGIQANTICQPSVPCVLKWCPLQKCNILKITLWTCVRSVTGLVSHFIRSLKTTCLPKKLSYSKNFKPVSFSIRNATQSLTISFHISSPRFDIVRCYSCSG